jgi:hypothetical protein
MSGAEEIWIPLVDEPIGTIVAQIQLEHPEIGTLVDTPRKLLAFRTFAYIRVGLVLGQLLVESDAAAEPDDGSDNWIEELLKDPAHHEQVVREVRAVAEEIAADPYYAGDDSLGPDEDARRRFREFAKKQLESS